MAISTNTTNPCLPKEAYKVSKDRNDFPVILYATNPYTNYMTVTTG